MIDIKEVVQILRSFVNDLVNHERFYRNTAFESLNREHIISYYDCYLWNENFDIFVHNIYTTPFYKFRHDLYCFKLKDVFLYFVTDENEYIRFVTNIREKEFLDNLLFLQKAVTEETQRILKSYEFISR